MNKYEFVIGGYTFIKWAETENEAFAKARAHYQFMTKG